MKTTKIRYALQYAGSLDNDWTASCYEFYTVTEARAVMAEKKNSSSLQWRVVERITSEEVLDDSTVALVA